MDLIQALITGFPFHPCSQRAEDTFMRNLKEQSLHIQSTAKAQRELFVSQLSKRRVKGVNEPVEVYQPPQ